MEAVFMVVFIFVSALFSAAETALMTLSNVRVRALARDKRKGSAALMRIKENPHRMLATVLLCNNLANIAAASLATVIFTEMFGSSGIGVTTGVMTFIVLLFGEVTPKTFATQHAVGISLAFARPLEMLSFALGPVVGFFEFISKQIVRLFGKKKDDNLSESEIRTIVTMGKEEGLLTKEAADMMHNLLGFKRTVVSEIMTPKSDVEMVSASSILKDVIDFVVKCEYTRYPVYLKNKNNIIGVLDESDVLRYAKDNKLGVKVKSVTRPVIFVPESKGINELFSEFEGNKVPMAMVVDEYGEVSGIVTVEDVLEEIVGNIFDKSRRRTDYVKKIHDKLFRIDARAPVEEMNKIFGLGLLEKHYFNTMAGYVEHVLQKIPKPGERIELDSAIIEVDEVTPHGIKSLKIIKK